ncbi:MAG: RNA polymerase sigma factor [Bacteroidota bacterium]
MDNKDSTCQQSSFRKLYERHSDVIRNFLYYKTGDSGFAEDAVQESYLQLWKKCADVPFEKAKSFLFAVSNNLMLDKFKHQKVKLKFFSRKQKQTTNETPEFLLEEQEFKQKLESVISELPEPQRVVFLMSRIDKMKYKEIAQALDISQKAVEKRMHKALLWMREKIGKV